MSPPSGFAWSPNGELLVADDFNHRIQVYNSESALVRQFGRKGKGDGEFQYPKGIAVDGEGSVYVADSWNHRVQKLDAQGNFLFAFGGYGAGRGQMNEPYDVLVEPDGAILVVERYNHRIQFFRSDGASLGWIGTRALVLEENLAQLYETPVPALPSPVFEFPTSIARDSKNNYLVADSGNHRLVRFDSNWTQLQSVGLRGADPGEFQYPLSVAVGPSDLIYVADLNNDRIQVLSPDGHFLYSLDQGAGGEVLKMPNVLLINPEGTLFASLTFNTGIFKFKTSSHVPEAPPSAPETSLLERLETQAQEFKTSRKEVLEAYKSWEEASSEFYQRALEKEALILGPGEDPRTFDKDYYLLDKQDKTAFRNIRRVFHEHLKATERFAALFSNSYPALESEAERTQAGALINNLLEDVCERILNVYSQREANEMEMLQAFAQLQNNQDQWSKFRVRFQSNQRTMETFKRLSAELRVWLQTLQSVCRPPDPWLRELAEDLFATHPKKRPAVKILLLTQEDWRDLVRLEQAVVDLFDAWSGNSEDAPIEKRAFNLDDFSPVAFDAEDLKPEDLAWSISGPDLEKTQSSLRLGSRAFAYEGKVDSAQLLSNLEKILQTQSTYQNKAEELFAQLVQLHKDLADQETKLKACDPRDKKAPIPILKSIQVQMFQISLLRRMIAVLYFNECNNVNRLAAGSGLLACMAPESAVPWFEGLKNYRAELQSGGDSLRENFKALTIENARLTARLSESTQNMDAGNLAEIAAQKKQGADLVLRCEIVATQLDQNQKIFSRVQALLEWAGNEGGLETLRGQSASRLSPVSIVKKNWGALSRPFLPLGLAHTADGDLVLTDIETHQLARVSPHGVFRFAVGGFGNAPGFFSMPVCVALDSRDCIYVADQDNRRAQKFSSDGKFLFQIGADAGEDIGTVHSVTVDAQDRLWIAQPSLNRIGVYNSDGSLKKILTEGGNAWKEPIAVCCLPNGNYVVADRSDFALKLFGPDEKLIAQIDRTQAACGDVYFITQSPEHGIFASDLWGRKILRFDQELNLEAVYEQGGRRAGEMGRMGGLSVYQDQLAASDLDNQRVQTFSLSGKHEPQKMERLWRQGFTST